MDRIQIILKTSAIECDDRVRKEAEYLSKRTLVHLSVLENQNKRAQGKCWGNVSYHSFSLFSRSLKQLKILPFTGIEFYLNCFFDYFKYRPKIIWIHDWDMIGLVLPFFVLKNLGLIKKIVWDLHELPSDSILRTPWKRKIYSFLISLCDHIIIASHQRKRLLSRLKMTPTKTHCIENYPDNKFIQMSIKNLPSKAMAWLSGEKYYLAQGGGGTNRHFEQLLQAFIEKQRKLIIIGGYKKEYVNQLKKINFDKVNRYLYFTGQIQQMDIIPYIDHAEASVILYGQRTCNGKYCAPNRLYQALARGVAVIVGNNVSMKMVVKSHHCGTVLSSDGHDEKSIVHGIEHFEAHREAHRKGAIMIKEKHVFSFNHSAFSELSSILES